MLPSYYVPELNGLENWSAVRWGPLYHSPAGAAGQHLSSANLEGKNMEVKQRPGTCGGLIDSIFKFDYLLLEVMWSFTVTQREYL